MIDIIYWTISILGFIGAIGASLITMDEKKDKEKD